MNNPDASAAIDARSFETVSAARGALSAVSWSAILAGAAAAAALSLILLILGVGLGLSSVSPWTHDGIRASTLGVSTILWITGTQVLAAGMGGYLAGRLRTRWLQVHADEVYFRDTAHGLLAWAVASLATAALLGSAIGSIVHGSAQAGASFAGAVADRASDMASANGNQQSLGYFVDSLFRSDGRAVETPTAAVDTGSAASSDEVTRIFMNTLRAGALVPDDVGYLGRMVAKRTGLSQAEAEKRVNEVYTAAQEKLRATELAARDMADKARKASAGVALWLFISLLAGAFVASLAATVGGRQRDQH